MTELKVEFYNPARIYQYQFQGLMEVFENVLRRGHFILGEQVSQFEYSFAQYLEGNHCIGVGSGTDALFLAIRSLNLPPGSEVLLAANSYLASVLAVVHNQLKPVFVDIDETSFFIDINKIEKEVTAKSKAIVVTHFYGRPGNMTGLTELAGKLGLILVEDCSHAHGASFWGKKVGSFGEVAAFSFYPTKNLAAIGDGGAVVTSNPERAALIYKLRNYGFRFKNYSVIKGFNSRLDELQAAVLLYRLQFLEKENDKRKAVAAFYHRHIFNEKIVLPQLIDGHVWHQFVIRCDSRSSLIRYLKSNGIETSVHYPVPVYRQPAFFSDFSNVEFPVNDALTKQIISLPINSSLSDIDLHLISDTINNF